MLKKTYLLLLGLLISLIFNVNSAKSAVPCFESFTIEQSTPLNDSLDRNFKKQLYDNRLVVKEKIVNLSYATVIFPNPIKNILIVKFEEAWIGEITIKLLDKKGKAVKSTAIDKLTPFAQLIINVNDLPKGAYILQIKKQNQIALKRIVKT